MKTIFRSFLHIAPLCLVPVALNVFTAQAFADTSESNLDKIFSVQPGGRFVLEADRGSVEITTGGEQVKINVKRKVTGTSAAKGREILDAHEVTFDQQGQRVIVSAKMDEAAQKLLRRGANFQVEYFISVPERFDLDLRTAAGSIKCANIEGTVKARTAGGSLRFQEIKGPFDGTTSAGSIELAGATGVVSARTAGGNIRAGVLGAESDLTTSAGSITVKNAKGGLKARTSGGNIEAGELQGPAKLETSAGSIHVDSAQAPLEARTSGGSIRLDDLQNTVVAQTSAGSINATISAQPEGDCRLTTSGGSITVKVDPELAFDVEARASGGRVTTELPVTMTVVGEHDRSGLKGKLNGGGKELVLRTSAGSIAIRRK